MFLATLSVSVHTSDVFTRALRSPLLRFLSGHRETTLKQLFSDIIVGQLIRTV